LLTPSLTSYDANIAGIRFVHGDGQIIAPEQVCMMQTFKDNKPNFNRSQRLHLIELIGRSVKHFKILNGGDSYALRTIKKQFQTISSVSESH